ncbi:MAG: class II fumarate hydratase [Acidimicrobiales bacterium]|nr:class II fumarate hydratase [Acidimicrobiales bacterium]
MSDESREPSAAGSLDRSSFRVEHDSMGEVLVPVDAKWGAHTQRAIDNFPISGLRVDKRLIRALALIKREAAAVNGASAEVQAVTPVIAQAIIAAADEVVAGAWDDQFPVDVFQTGSGTSTNMNMNEVLADLASERLGAPGSVHPNDHVNASQSSNDVFPTAMHLAVVEGLTAEVIPALQLLHDALAAKATEFAGVVKAGRTHLMDATPVTLGQEFGGYAEQVRQSMLRIERSLPSVGQLPLGGTAVGTGLNAPAGFGRAVIERLAERTGLPLTEAPDHFAVHGARDALVEASGQLRVLAVVLVKIANDLRWMGSGPRAGLAEIRIPDLQPGSSIMPGKVNPVIPEAVTQVAAQVIGHDATVAFCGSQGAFELNVYLPVMAHNLLESITLLANVSRLFADRCVKGIEADVDRCRYFAEVSPAIATALNPHLGYETVASIVQEAGRTGRTIREIVLERGVLDRDLVERVLDVLAMTKGGIR